ncbi:hypothetical protein PGTUg99_005355 [Puccinia graminis f. sp. tritici]|uniref:Uncharacterized protein n=1 Tax=Puccinia graminis f. sp. tritici TaxID=56615 RepID=A0A5B0NUR2_PUCGR|nr:hypothetical protein PGTUg99_005355 [Puccinia graminis f. sp. tritici]
MQFFNTDEIAKLVGNHLVRIYGEDYPAFSKFVNFKPDMDFLKTDLRTSTMHWWLNLLDMPIQGKILYRSMQTLFSKLGIQNETQNYISSATWKKFLDDKFIDGFQWKGETSHSSEIKSNHLLINTLLEFFQQASRSKRRQEYLESFWIIRFVITYNSNNIYEILCIRNSEFKVQYEMTETALQMHNILNWSYVSQWWFHWDHKNVCLQHDNWIQMFKEPTDKEEAEKYGKIQDKYQELLEKLDLNEGREQTNGIRSLLKVFEYSGHKFFLNDWLRTVEFTVVPTILPVIDIMDPNRFDIFKMLLNHLIKKIKDPINKLIGF